MYLTEDHLSEVSEQIAHDCYGTDNDKSSDTSSRIAFVFQILFGHRFYHGESSYPRLLCRSAWVGFSSQSV